MLLHPKQLNPYLKDAPDAFVWSRSSPLSDAPRIGIGSQPIDDGNYLFTRDDKDAFLADEPQAEEFFHRWLGSREFLQGVERWVLWLGEVPAAQLARMPMSLERVRAVQEYRLASKRAQTKKAAKGPQHFGTEIISSSTSILIPEVSSERRRYIPLGFVDPDVFCSDLVFLIPNASLYHFGVLHSRVHNAWMRTVAGRLKSDFRYSGGVVHHTFVWPTVTPEQEDEIAQLAQNVLKARSQYGDSTISEMYSPDTDFLFADLFTAHAELDEAVERAYGLTPGLPEDDLVAHLFTLYAQAVN